MRLDVYTPSGTQSGAEANDVKRSGNVGPSHGTRAGITPEDRGGPWLKERPQVSSMGVLMRELHGIKTDNPHAFAELTATIGLELHNLAAEEAPESADRLIAMAERFERASSQGDLSPFRADPQPYGQQMLRGPWAYRQTSELQEVRADVQELIGRVLDSYVGESGGQTDRSTGTESADASAQRHGNGNDNTTLVTVG